MYRLLSVINILGILLMAFSFAIAIPAMLSLAYDDGAANAYDEAFLATLVSGLLLWGSTRHHRHELQPRDGFLLVSLVWTMLPAFASLPLLFHIEGLTVTDAYFEAVSGLTATGATVLSGLDGLPPSINFWRMFMHWIGGMGVMVLAVAILPILGVGGSQIFKAEAPGPMKDSKLTPRITETAKGLWGVYVIFTLACIVAFHIAGMNWFDAVVHAFSTMALGGFSSHDLSLGYFNSPAIEMVAMFFMVIAGISFGCHFLALRRRSVRPYWVDPEVRVYIVVVLVSSVMLALFLKVNGVYGDFFEALRYASFNAISVATTTGFSTTDYSLWPVFAPIWILFLGCFSACSGSTGGGIKMIRAVIMIKQALREMQRIVHPRAYIPIKLSGATIENNIVFAILAFMLVYGGTIVFFTMLMTASGLDLVTAASAIVACVNNIGPGLAQVGPATTFAVLTDFQTWLCTAAMLLGRLELLTLLVIFTPGFWRY